jgi:undecaprenyl-diphosphatase
MPAETPVQRLIRDPWWLAMASALFVVLLALLVTTGITDPIDVAISDLIRAPAALDLLAPLRQVTQLGSSWAVTAIAALLLVGGSLAGRPRDAITGAATIALAAALIEIVKVIVARTRPEVLEPILVETGFSFPSGHAANAMVAYGVVGVVLGRTSLGRWPRVVLQVLLGSVIGLVGVSRVWLGVHYPTDVLAGWATGLVAVCAYVALTRPAWPGPGAAAAGADRAGRRSGRPAAD